MIKSILKLTFWVSFITLIGCSSEDEPTPSDECGMEISALTDEYTNFIMVYADNPTMENCLELKSIVTEIINAFKEAQNCAPNAASVSIFKDTEESWQVVLGGLPC